MAEGLGPADVAGLAGDAASRIQAYATCQGANSRTCDPVIDQKFQQYQDSADPKEREQLIAEIQNYMMDNAIFVSIWRFAFLTAQGPRIANDTKEIWGSLAQYGYPGPYEDIRLKSP